MRAPSSIAMLILGSLVLFAGCRGGSATATERLWVSGLPTTPRAPLTAFATTRTGDGKYLGAFFQGTLFRGGHDVFQWTDDGPERATLQFLQDKRTARIRLETCKPSTGFDYCLLVKGDPTGTERYQSRKRWVVRRPGRRRDAGTGFVLDVITELAEDDDELAALLDAEP